MCTSLKRTEKSECFDCLFDETRSINNSCPQIQRHRFQCSESELTCLLVGTIANRGLDCNNKRDEIDYRTGTVLIGNNHCSYNDVSRCNYLQNYIQISSKIDVEDQMFNDDLLRANHSKNVIPFRSYCDSFFLSQRRIR